MVYLGVSLWFLFWFLMLLFSIFPNSSPWKWNLMIYSGLLHLPLFYPDVHMPLITNFSLILLFLFVLFCFFYLSWSLCARLFSAPPWFWSFFPLKQSSFSPPSLVYLTLYGLYLSYLALSGECYDNPLHPLRSQKFCAYHRIKRQVAAESLLDNAQPAFCELRVEMLCLK